MTEVSGLPKVKGCDKDAYHVFSKPTKNYDLDIFLLVETDDDLPNYCHDKDQDGTSFRDASDFDISLMPNCIDAITSTDHLCIDPGPDGSIDLGLDIQSYLKGKNEIVLIPPNGIVKTAQNSIKAGIDMECNTRPVRSGDDGPFDFGIIGKESPYSVSAAEIASRFNYINQFFAKFGVQVNPNIETLERNFDFKIENNVLEYVLVGPPSEYKTFFYQLFGFETSSGTTTVKDPVRPTLFFINDLEDKGANPAGGLSFTGENISVVEDNLSERVWKTSTAHELGHGMLGLPHPSDQFNTQKTPDNSDFMKKSAEQGASEDLLDLSSKYYQWVKVHK